ncbi:hypothetical protein Ancab_003218 [Ancistrocladus abbreviatus]
MSLSPAVILILLLNLPFLCYGGITSSYVRQKYASTSMPLEAFPPPPGYNAPEQVHITQGDRGGRGMIISWVTPVKRHPNVVKYWKADSHGTDKHKLRHATIEGLEYDTKYVYELGHGNTTRQFSFTTPPKVGPDVPYTFGIIGDVGQTRDSNQTLEHYMANLKKGQTVLFVGDLSYADDHPFHDQRRWDTWGRFVEKSAAYQPWIFAAGNHELDFAPQIERISNIRYNITNGLSTPIRDPSAPVYFILGDGGDIEGRADNFTVPQPDYSAYREASFGHAILEIKNHTHAYFTWNRNQDDVSIEADSTWFFNRYWHPKNESRFINV